MDAAAAGARLRRQIPPAIVEDRGVGVLEAQRLGRNGARGDEGVDVDVTAGRRAGALAGDLNADGMGLRFIEAAVRELDAELLGGGVEVDSPLVFVIHEDAGDAAGGAASGNPTDVWTGERELDGCAVLRRAAQSAAAGAGVGDVG